jgi:hypothetical protein
MGKMSDQAKENMAMGMKAMCAVDAYLTYMDQKKPGRRIDRSALEEKAKAETNLAHKVIIIAQIHEAIRREDEALKEAEWEQEFVKYAPWFSEQHGITYAVWREMGVNAKVLSKAGITQ